MSPFSQNTVQQNAENLGDVWVHTRKRRKGEDVQQEEIPQGRSGSYKNLEYGDRGTPSSTFAVARAILTALCLSAPLDNWVEVRKKYGPMALNASDPVCLLGN